MKKYEWVEVVSSNIEKVAYDDAAKELLIGFTNKTEYYFVNVPKKLYEGLLDSASKGQYFNRYIKKDFGYGRHR